jgi:uncharacterized protein (TIGR02271 family)
MQRYEIVEPGFDVVDPNGDKVGAVEDVSTNYFVVTKGLFFPRDVYIPMSAVDSVDGSAAVVHLNVGRDEIDSMHWDSVPEDRTDAGVSGATTGRTTTDDRFTVPLREEQLQAERRERQAGEVAVGKHVIEQEQVIEVPVTHEEVDITRRRVDRPAHEGDKIIDDGETIRVPLRAEEVDVRKDSRVVEEVEISKRPVTETQRVSETVRREEIDVDTAGEVAVSGGRNSKRERR